MTTAVNLINDGFNGSSPPSIFVGRYGYPKVNVGVLAPARETEDAWIYDAPEYWANKELGIKEIIKFRSSLINSRFVSNIKSFSGKLLDLSQEVAMASKPVDMEVYLTKKPKQEFHFENITMPMGPSAQLRKLKLTSNPKITNAVERVYGDTDLKAVNAIGYLYKKNFDLNSITKLLSIGVFGIKKNRKLVPTRWSISAVHDTLGKRLIKQIKDYQEINEYYFYSGGYLGNYYFILMTPNIWGYELFESYMPKSLWNPNQELAVATDIEYYDGRKEYASETTGGYYAARLPILEKLNNMKRQAGVIVFRFVTEEYTCPLGVWVVNEAVKKTLENVPLKSTDQKEILKDTANEVKKKFGYNLNVLIKKSKLLEMINTQMRLSSY